MKIFVFPTHPGDETLTALEHTLTPEHWTARAQCASSDPEMFFCDADGPTAHRAKAVCRHCPVSAQCLALAVRLDVSYGIWGGLLPHERKSPKGATA